MDAIEKRVEEIIKKQEKKKAERRSYMKTRSQNRKVVPFSAEAYEDFEKRQQSGENEKVMMKRFKKYQVGDVVLGLRAGTINNIRPGKLVYGYYTINDGMFWNCAWVIRCLDDGKLRSFQGIKKIRSKKELAKINKKREDYLKIWADGRDPVRTRSASKIADEALTIVLLEEKK